MNGSIRDEVLRLAVAAEDAGKRDLSRALYGVAAETHRDDSCRFAVPDRLVGLGIGLALKLNAEVVAAAS